MKKFIAYVLCTVLLCMSLPLGGLSDALPPRAAGGTQLTGNEILTSGLWRYVVNDEGYAVITGYAGLDAVKLTIPDKLGGHFVAGVGERAFAPNAMLKRIEIPGNVLSIAPDAFDGLRDLTIEARNGSEALAFAKREGFAYTNLSTLYFTENVVDYTDIPKGRYAYVDKNTLRMDALEARRLWIGALFYMPPDKKYELGEAFEVLNLTQAGDSAIIAMRKADPKRVITRVVVKETNMLPDYDNMVVLSEGVTIRKPGVRSKTGGSLTGNAGCALDINWEYKGITISGGVSSDLTANMDIDVNPWPFRVNRFKCTLSDTTSLNVKVEAKSESLSDELSLDLVRVPFSSIGVVTAFVVVKVDVNLKGEIEIKYEVESVRGAEYVYGEFKPIRKVVEKNFEIRAAVKISVLVKLGICVSVPILGDILDLSLGLGPEFEIKPLGISEGVLCNDIAISILVKIGLKFGFIDGDSPKAYVSVDLLNVSMKLKTMHMENLKPVPRCTVGWKKVTFNTGVDDDDQDPIEDQLYKVGEKITRPRDPVNPGYSFAGWRLMPGGETWNFDSDTVQDDMTLMARWDDDEGQQAPTEPGSGYPSGELEPPWGPWEPDDPEDPEYLKNLSYLQYSKYSNYVVITGYKNDPVDLSIPEKIDKLHVTSIGDNAFKGCVSLTSVVIPNSVTSIGESVFEDCASLTSVVIPNSVTNIGPCAFWKCTSLKSAVIPNSVMSTGESTFYGCTSLTNVVIPNGVTNIGWRTFDGCTGLTSIVIPNSVTRIAGYAFRDCRSLTSVTIPNSVTSIEDYAFRGCTSLTSMTIPNSLTSIGEEAFYGCTSLTSVVIPNSVTNIGAHAFGSCTSLTSMVIPNSVTSIKESVFENCASLTSVVIPNSIISIEGYAFDGCRSLTSVVIPNSVTSIGARAFSSCTSLTSLVIPNSVTSIGNFIFYDCTSLTSLVIPNNVTSIGDGTFNDCTSLTSVVIPNSLTSIVDYMFAGCTSLTSYVIPNSVTEIGYGAFRDCTSLTSVVIPNSVTSIEGWAFFDCYSLMNVDIPNSVISIGDYAFADCYDLASIVIRNNAVYIGFRAFSALYDLNTVYCGMGSETDEYFSSDVRKIYFDNQMRQVTWQSAYGGGDTSFVDPGAKLTKPTTPFRDGYAFRGWYKDSAFNTPWDFANDTMPDADMTLYARWDEDPEYGFVVAPPNTRAAGIYIVSYTGDRLDIIIPDRVNGQTVVGISPGAFGDEILTISIPASVTDIQPGAFRYASSLSSISVDDDNPAYKSEGGVLYSKDGRTLIQYPRQKIGNSFAIPGGVTSIADRAFEGASLSTITLPQTLNSIGAYAFQNCAYLESLTIPDGDTAIGAGAFYGVSDDFALFGPIGDNTVSQYAADNYLGYNRYPLTLYNGTEAIMAMRKTAGQTIDDPLIDGLGYSYDGWETSAGALWNFAADVMPAAPLNLYARNLKRTSFVLSFNTQSGAKVASLELKAGELIEEPTCVRQNYTLIEWRKSDGTVWNFATDTMPEADLTLYAVWLKIDETIPDVPFTYAIDGGEITITGFLGGVWSAEIPSAIGGMPVTKIADYAFYADKILDVVTLPDSIIEIGAYAFADSRVSKVVMSNSVSTIGEQAFYSCKSLHTITLSNQIADIPQGMLGDCTALTTLTIPEGVRTLSAGVLAGCSYLESLTLPGSLTAIGADALSGCRRLAAINLKNVSFIGENAFNNCGAVSNVTVNAGNASFSARNNVLMDKSETTVIYYPAGLTAADYTLNKIAGPYAFRGSRIENLTIGNSATLSEGSFRDSISLKTLTFASGCTLIEIPAEAFANCVALESVALPNSVKTLGASAFSNCRSLAAIHISDGVTTIGDGALPNTKNLVVYGEIGSAAQNYAVKNGLRFVSTSGVPVTDIALDADEADVQPGETLQLTATLTPSNTSETNIVWTSSRENVASVDENGTVTGLQYGSATITATAANATSASCQVTVRDAEVLVTNIELSFSTLSLPKQYAGLINAYVEPENATNRSVIWTSSNDSVVMVNERGMLAALNGGTATITATAADGSGVSASCTVMVTSSGYILGDVTGDKLVDNRDIITILGWINNAVSLDELQKLCADYDEDGDVNQRDAQLMLKVLVGLAA